MTDQHGRQLHRPDEFKTALEEASPVDVDKLVRASRALAWRSGMEADDLLQLAFVRILENTRPWPCDVALVPFVKGVMRSLASGEAERRASSPVRQARSMYDTEGALAVEVADASRSVEEAMLAQEECDRIQRDLWDICSRDEAAALILMGMQDGRDGEELMLETGLTKTEYDTKRRWVRRRINSYLEGRATA
jgi:RNA polymerase sigma-70 factor (ECF subfamily)